MTQTIVVLVVCGESQHGWGRSQVIRGKGVTADPMGMFSRSGEKLPFSSRGRKARICSITKACTQSPWCSSQYGRPIRMVPS